MREDRLVLPIPPGLHWRDEMPVMVPQEPVVGGELSVAKGERRGTKLTRRAAGPEVMAGPVKHGPRQYDAPPAVLPVVQRVAEKIKLQKKEKAKVDPKRVAAARELRDRYLEQVNATPEALPAPGARYDVTRALPAMVATPAAMQIEAKPLRQLPSAA